MANPESGPAPLTVKCDAHQSYDVDGEIVEYHWLLRDPELIRAEGPEFEHTFEAPGDYRVIKWLMDDDGAVTVVNRLIRVE